MPGIWQKLKRNLRPEAASANAAPDAGLAEAERLIAAGNALEDDGEFAAALDRYRAAATIAPAFPRAHMNVGNALRRLERWDEAIAAQRRAVECDPQYARARCNLGLLLAERGESKAAEEELLQALRLDPAMSAARVALADVYERADRLDDAEAQFRAALASDPGHAGVLLNFGMFCLRQGQIDDALEALREAKRIDPDIRGVDSQMLFAMNFRFDLTPQEVAEAHRRVGRALTQAAAPRFDRWANPLDADRRLKIGYVSGDFGPHPVALFLRPILQQHDRARCEVYCYSNAPDFGSIARTLRERADHWRDIALLSDERVADQVRNDGIDILVDLSGHTGRDRLSVFARHPAPVQVTWLGYLNTTGLPAMDYRITDANTDPVGETEALHTEQLARMPHCQWCYFAWHEIDRIAIPHPERPDALVFGSFNQYVKITDRSLALWSAILAQVPEAELAVLDVRRERNRIALLDRMRRQGIDERRVALYGRVPIRSYFAAMGNVDIALDTFPYNGATTTLDTLWMGVPLVAWRGERGISRGSYSILRALGLDELIASSEDQYVELNVKLARDPEWRQRLRESLRERLSASPLMDAAGFTRALEERYREMWQAWCSKQSGATRAPSA